jgi:rhodanese-related sulfurtransferase
MRTLLFAVALAGSVLACTKAEEKQVDPQAFEKLSDSVPEVTIEELASQLAAKGWVAVDANGTVTRQRLGVIPGAVLLTDSEVFSTSELPADKAKTLVFYCANSHCSASNEAAARAILAGYKHAKVLPDGIAGWVAAGKQIQKI